jgi:hypothetical protein
MLRCSHGRSGARARLASRRHLAKFNISRFNGPLAKAFGVPRFNQSRGDSRIDRFIAEAAKALTRIWSE